jgi:ATP-dependent RNA helicase RhlE
VVNYELPQVPEDYVHRIGRTGRAGEAGEALSLVCPEEQPRLVAIETLLKYAIPRQTIAEFPQIAVKRGGKAKLKGKIKTGKKTKGPSKPKKKPDRQKNKVSTKATTSRRGKAETAQPAPKLGRRLSRTKSRS